MLVLREVMEVDVEWLLGGLDEGGGLRSWLSRGVDG